MPQKVNKKASTASKKPNGKKADPRAVVRARNQSVEEKNSAPHQKEQKNKRTEAKQESLVPASSKLINQIIPFALFVLVLLSIVKKLKVSYVLPCTIYVASLKIGL